MANYPATNPSFTTKQDGVDYPQASHINTIQEEVVAIGTALRTGLDHALTVNTGGFTVSSGGATVSTGGLRVGGPSTLAALSATASTVASLNVTGASTFAGAVTFGSSVTFTGVIYPLVPACLLTHSASVSISSATWTGLNWDTEVLDAQGMHSTASNSSRITFVDSTGVYHLAANVILSSLTTGHWLGRIRVNDTTTVAQVFVNPPSAVTLAGLSLQATVRVSSTSYYATVQVQSLSQASSVYADSATTPVSFNAVFVSK